MFVVVVLVSGVIGVGAVASCVWTDVSGDSASDCLLGLLVLCHAAMPGVDGRTGVGYVVWVLLVMRMTGRRVVVLLLLMLHGVGS